MNKKSYMKIGILLMVGLFICAGCSAQQGEKYTYSKEYFFFIKMKLKKL